MSQRHWNLLSFLKEFVDFYLNKQVTWLDSNFKLSLSLSEMNSSWNLCSVLSGSQLCAFFVFVFFWFVLGFFSDNFDISPEENQVQGSDKEQGFLFLCLPSYWDFSTHILATRRPKLHFSDYVPGRLWFSPWGLDPTQNNQ